MATETQQTTTQTTRIRPKNILFCTDFSAAASHALPYAADLARHFGSKLWAMHVYLEEPERVEVSSLEKYSPAQAKEKIREMLKPFADVPQEVLVPQGQIWPCIEAALREDQIDLLVIGTRGRTGISKFLLGSSAEEMFRRADCAVLTVGPHVPAAPNGVGKKEISDILYATDFGPHSEGAAAYAISLAQEYQANLTLLHVMPEPKDGDLYVITEELKHAAEKRLRELVPPESKLWCEPNSLVEEGKVAEEILKIAADRKVGLIVLGAHRPSGFPGAATHLSMAIAHQVITHATCPVLTVRD